MSYITANVDGPKLYLKMYDTYHYLLNGSAEKSLKEFLKTEPRPLLRDFGVKIKGFDALRNEISLLRNKVG